MARAQGSGSAAFWMVVLGVLAAMHCSSLLAVSGLTYTVGDDQGWTIGPNYTTWAEGKNFTTGDILYFPYAKGAHDVDEVNKTGYDACSASNANTIASHVDGNTNVTLTAVGTRYFICSFPTHCTDGMKLAVTVNATGTPTPSTSPPSGSSPSGSSPGSSAPRPLRSSAPSFAAAFLLVGISGALLAL